MRDPDGTITPFDPPGAIYTSLERSIRAVRSGRSTLSQIPSIASCITALCGVVTKICYGVGGQGTGEQRNTSPAALEAVPTRYAVAVPTSVNPPRSNDVGIPLGPP